MPRDALPRSDSKTQASVADAPQRATVLLPCQKVRRLRSSEVLILVYFAYVAAITPFFIQRFWRAWLVLIAIGAVFALASRLPKLDVLRDWLPLAAALIAFKQMDWFTRVTDHHLEQPWLRWDRWLFNDAHLRAVIESTGALLPGFLELCYLLVYAVAPVSLWLLLRNHRRAQINRFWLAYLAGTLGAYALFPYFPSQPPRTLFPGQDLPQFLTGLRRLNLFILGNYSIHSSVFPSAHVSSAFSAAWGLLAVLPNRVGWWMAAYGFCVALATVYGRYHYAADVAAGFAVSFLALAALKLSEK